MTTVSILIPAHRPEFVKQAIASALAQTFEDIEILVGDNTPNGALEQIVREFDSPKLKYFHHGFDNGGDNARALWAKASGRYVKWLFYDDVLMPASVEVLIEALQTYPDSLMAFHERAIIDESGAVVYTPPRLLGDGQLGLMDRSYIARRMVGQMDNFIGEPSFLMLDKSRIDLAEMGLYKGHEPNFLGDVCAYLEVAGRAPIVAVGGYFGGFRKHGAQESAAGSPIFAMGLIEWEVFLRGEAADGNLTIREILAAKQRLEHVYGHYVAQFPELQRFIEGLAELTDEVSGRLFESEKFQANLAHAREVTKARVAAGRLRKQDAS
ncbi:glycosyltransferase family 2 protein [Paraburkholderia phymatum]|uniref:Glycosyltransferase family 2 protein n=1 Tax=Paraburkholderia phymatum TaxID=148447 RepID=A0ACC6U8P5_9BURK